MIIIYFNTYVTNSGGGCGDDSDGDGDDDDWGKVATAWLYDCCTKTDYCEHHGNGDEDGDGDGDGYGDGDTTSWTIFLYM